MGLKFELDTLDGLEDGQKALYEKADGGKFRLAVEGLPQQEDVGGLKSALQKERERAAKYEKQVQRLERLGKTPDEIEAIIAAQEKTAEEEAKKKGDFEALRKQDRDRFEKKEAELTAERDAAREGERSAIIESRLTAALVKGKATEAGIELLSERLARQVKVETVDGKRVTRITQEDGSPMAGSGPEGLATFDDLVVASIKKFPSLFEGSGGSGGGKQAGQGAGGAGRVITEAEFNAMNAKDRAKAMSEGATIKG